MSEHTSPTVKGGRRMPPTPTEATEHARRQVDRLCWTGILLGLAFTMTNFKGLLPMAPVSGRCPGWQRGSSIRWCRWSCWRSFAPSRSPPTTGFAPADGCAAPSGSRSAQRTS